MCEELDEEQLLEFCQRLGLAEDGYLDEKDLSVVCNCIGLNAPDEMMKELFQDLDGDGDGKVCLAELGQMLRGMQNKMSPGSPNKNRNSHGPEMGASSAVNNNVSPTSEIDFCTLPISERGAFTILDPQHTGFAKIGNILDLWCQLGVSRATGTLILKDMGFPSSVGSNSINLQDLARCIENETDHCKEIGLPPVVHVALATYRTEAQYLRSVCESMECERDKLKSDIVDAHHRTAMLAQEVDEQNTRLERNTQTLLHKSESKYLEQIHEIQKRFAAEKEYFQNALKTVESQLRSLKEEEIGLKSQIIELSQQNGILENEKQSEDAATVARLMQQLQSEISRYNDLENKLQDLEKRHLEKANYSEAQLQKAYGDIHSLRDQNDELSAQVECMKENLNKLRATQGKRYYVKRRKESAPHSTSLPFVDGDRCLDDCTDFPLEKIGKYNPQSDRHVFTSHEIDPEEYESSMEPVPGASPSSPLDSGNFPCSTIISLAACMGESSTDRPDLFSGHTKYLDFTENGESCSKVENLERQYRTLENEMDSVKEKIVVILAEKEKLISENKLLREQLEETISQDKPCSFRTMKEVETQTSFEVEHMDLEMAQRQSDFLSRVQELEQELVFSRSCFKNENQDLQNKCSNLENSLELLQVEYEKCEDYWQGKLQEERDIYDQLALKIREYEELLLQQTESDDDSKDDNKLCPIEERASLEQQVNDYLEEMEQLRSELVSIKSEQVSEIENYQRKWEVKNLECSHMEEQLNAVTRRCHDYESRLTALAEEERVNTEDTSIVEILKDRVYRLEVSLQEQDNRHRQHVEHLDKSWKEREHNLKKAIPDIQKAHVNPTTEPTKVVDTKSVSPLPTNPSECSKILLDILHKPAAKAKEERLWSGRVADKSASLPFIPNVDMTSPPVGSPWGNTSPSLSQDVWAPSSQVQNRKAWCHVELGWLQSLRSKLKQREEQCYGLQLALNHRELQSEKQLMEMKYQQAVETSNWECLVRTQAEKLAHADLLLKDLWVENAKVMAALNATEQKVIQLEKLLKLQMSTSDTSSGSLSTINNILSTNTAASITSPHHSLPTSYSYFSS